MTPQPIRIIFMGSAQLSCPSLGAMLKLPGAEVVAVVTQPDRPKGRHLKPGPSPVKEVALQAGIRVLQPERARDKSFIQQLSELSPDLIVVAAYGQILPPAILEMPRFGCINVHTSLLPKYRGAAPIQWALLNGESETGITIMKMDAGLDTGDILTQQTTPILPDDTSQVLHERLAHIGASLLAATIPAYIAGEITPRPQPAEGVVYAPKIKKQDGQIDWSQPATDLWNRVRAFTPWPGAYTWFDEAGSRLRLKLLKVEPDAAQGSPGQVLVAAKNTLLVACGQGALRISSLQLEGARPLETQQFLAGHPIKSGYIFSGASAKPSSQ
jgi:methionyl-tRNA formyltransferase